MWIVKVLGPTGWQPITPIVFDGHPPALNAVSEGPNNQLSNYPSLRKHFDDELKAQFVEGQESRPRFVGFSAIDYWRSEAEELSRKYAYDSDYWVKCCDENSIGLFEQHGSTVRPVSLAWHDQTTIVIPLPPAPDSNGINTLELEYVPSREDERREHVLPHRYGLTQHEVETYFEFRNYIGRESWLTESMQRMQRIAGRFVLTVRTRAAAIAGKVLRRASDRSQPTLTRDPGFSARLHRSEQEHSRCAAAFPDLAQSAPSTAQRAAVFIHGTVSCGIQSLKELWPSLSAAGLQKYVPLYRYEHDTFRPIDENAEELMTLIAERLQVDELYLIGHSRGGIVARYAAQLLESGRAKPNVKEILTIGTPHLGTPLVSMGTTVIHTIYKLGETVLSMVPAVGALSQAFGYLVDSPELPAGINALARDSQLLTGMRPYGINRKVTCWGALRCQRQVPWIWLRT